MRHVIFLLCFLTLAGCATTGPDIPELRSWSARAADVEAKHPAKAGETPRDTQSRVQQIVTTFQQNPTERRQYITDAEATYKSIKDSAPHIFAELGKLANGNSKRSLIVSSIGIMSGLTATVLLVASPANAVWAAAFSGASSGALGFQTRLAQEGFTRAAVAREYSRLKAEFSEGAIEYSNGMTLLTTSIDDDTPTKWDQGIAKVQSGLRKMERVIIFRYFPTAINDDLDAIRQKDQEILDAIKQLQQENSQLNKKVEKLLQN